MISRGWIVPVGDTIPDRRGIGAVALGDDRRGLVGFAPVGACRFAAHVGFEHYLRYGRFCW